MPFVQQVHRFHCTTDAKASCYDSVTKNLWTPLTKKALDDWGSKYLNPPLPKHKARARGRAEIEGTRA